MKTGIFEIDELIGAFEGKLEAKIFLKMSFYSFSNEFFH